MGAWNYGVFDDDVAYDVLFDLKNSKDIVSDMESYFDRVISAEYIDYDDGIYALVCSSVIDSAINGTEYRCDEDDYLQWISTLKSFDFSSLIDMAIKSIDSVLSDSSELKELWEENEELYKKWQNDKLSIKKRLQ